MYKEQIKTLPIDFNTMLTFYDMSTKQPYPNTTQIQDIGYQLENGESPFLPEYGIKGFCQNFNNFEKLDFWVGDGPHILYITCIPINYRNTEPYNLIPRLWVTVWKDNKYQYLIQLTEIN